MEKEQGYITIYKCKNCGMITNELKTRCIMCGEIWIR